MCDVVINVLYFKWSLRVRKWFIVIVVMFIKDIKVKKMVEMWSGIGLKLLNNKNNVKRGCIIKLIKRFDIVRFDSNIYEVECKEDVF